MCFSQQLDYHVSPSKSFCLNLQQELWGSLVQQIILDLESKTQSWLLAFLYASITLSKWLQFLNFGLPISEIKILTIQYLRYFLKCLLKAFSNIHRSLTVLFPEIPMKDKVFTVKDSVEWGNQKIFNQNTWQNLTTHYL